MELKEESRIGRLKVNHEQIYEFLSDCNHFQQFTAKGKVQNWQSDNDSCRFTVEGAGDMALRIVERRPGELVKFAIENAQAENVFLWVQMKSVNTGDTRVKLTVKMQVNPMLRMFISKPLKQGLDKIVTTLESIY